MTTPPKDQTTFGRGASLPRATTVPAEARRATRWSLQPLAVARRVCVSIADGIITGLCLVLLFVCGIFETIEEAISG